MRALLLITSVALALATGCKDVGDSCVVNGDGFTRSDPCSGMCVEWAITCPDGTELNPRQCAGDSCSEDADCESGQICLQVDSFVENSRCMMASVCE